MDKVLFKLQTTNQEIQIPVSKIVSVRNDSINKRSFIYFEEMNDGTFRMTYSSEMIPDIL